MKELANISETFILSIESDYRKNANLFGTLLMNLCKLLRALLLAYVLLLSYANAQELTSAANVDLTAIDIVDLMRIDIVSSATKYPLKTSAAPASVSVISAEDIKFHGYRTLAAAMESLQGFHVTYDRNYMFLGTRGISLGDFNSRMLLLVDGHRVNNNLTDGAYLGTAFILDVDLIDRVEVIRGPGSVLYGNNAFFGVINVVTRKGKQLNGVEVSGEYGEFDTWKGRVTYGKAFTNGVELLLSGSYYDSRGDEKLYFPEFNTPDQNSGIARNMDADWFGSVFGSLSYRDFSLEGAFIDRAKENPTAQFLTTFNDPRLRTYDKRGYTRLIYTHDFDDVVNVLAQVYYDRNDFDIGYPTGQPVATSFFKETQVGEWWGAEVQLRKTIWDKHIVSVGAEYRDDFRQEQRLFEPATRQVFADSDRSRQSHGVYAEGDFTVITNLHLNAGIRYDQYGDFDPTFNPRLALIYHPFQSSTVKAIYGTAFRAPNFLELSDLRFQNITPEEVDSYELVYEQGIGRNLRTSVAGFYNRMDNLIVLEDGVFTNLDADSRGVELAAQANWPAGITNWARGIRARASYTFQDTENRSTDEELPDSPEHLVKLNLSVPVIKDKLFASLEFQFTGRRGTLFTTTTSETLRGRDVSASDVLNFTLFSQNLIKNLDVSASIYNLLDNDYDDPSTRFHVQDRIAQDGRAFRVKMTYRF
jgi:iron complex outermembrane receptor protein